MICSSFKQSPKTCKYKLFQISSSLSCAKGNKCASSPSCIGISIFSYLILFSINFCSVPLLSNGFSFNLFKDESISFSKSVKFCLLRKYSKTISITLLLSIKSLQYYMLHFFDTGCYHFPIYKSYSELQH